MDRVHVRVRRQVRAEQDPVRVAQEECPRRVWLAAELADPRGDVDVEVRVRVEQPADEPEVLRRAADVGADELVAGWPRDQPPERLEELVERRETRQLGRPAVASARSASPGWR